KARDTTGNIAGKYLGLENAAVVMAKSGARGSKIPLENRVTSKFCTDSFPR
ncbi:MAG: hypothetical protein JRE13_13845, partial [Deltaproteobacteria bacterium]|nr:hypothetical protein [Deltaproteobacteria bacterium]